jgi:hypothetical protein
MTYTQLQFRSPRRTIFRSRAFAQSVPFFSDANLPVQSPLTRLRVMLSLSVIAYYGLIRHGGRQFTSLFSSSGKALPFRRADDHRFPTLLCMSFPSCHLPYPGAPLRCIGLFLPSRLRSSPSSDRLDSRGSGHFGLASSKYNEAVEFARATARWGACRSPTTAFTFTLSLSESPLNNVEYHYMAK